MRQLVVGEAHRAGGGGPRRPRRANRRGSWPPGHSRSTRRAPPPVPLRPRCRPACGRTARGRAGPCRPDGPGPVSGAVRRPGQPSSDACGSQSKVSSSPASSDDPDVGRQEVEQRVEDVVDLPTPWPSAATTIGTRASMSSHSCAASSASSVPVRINSTIERGCGGIGRNAQRPLAGETSATGCRTRELGGRRPTVVARHRGRAST